MRKAEDITIVVDIDDTIEDLLGAWCKWLNNHYNTDVQPNSINEWDMTKAFPMLSYYEIFSPLIDEKFWETVEPKQDAIRNLQYLYESGYNLYLCTSTSYQNVKMKYELIVKKYFSFIDWDHVIIAHDKPMIKTDIMIDDGIHNLENGDYIKILMTAPHNRFYDETEQFMLRVDDWNEIVNVVEMLRYYEITNETLQRHDFTCTKEAAIKAIKIMSKEFERCRAERMQQFQS